MFSSATQLLRGPSPHNLVSAITFEGFKLRSSNLTHALLIQISRTNSIIDIVIPSKMATGGHFVKKKKKVAYRSEMARNAIESYLRTSKMAASGHFVKFKKKKIKFHMDLKWPEMPSKVNFRHPKWPTNLKWPEMRSKSEFRTSKMAAVSHIVKN